MNRPSPPRNPPTPKIRPSKMKADRTALGRTIRSTRTTWTRPSHPSPRRRPSTTLPSNASIPAVAARDADSWRLKEGMDRRCSRKVRRFHPQAVDDLAYAQRRVSGAHSPCRAVYGVRSHAPGPERESGDFCHGQASTSDCLNRRMKRACAEGVGCDTAVSVRRASGSSPADDAGERSVERTSAHVYELLRYASQ